MSNDKLAPLGPLVSSAYEPIPEALKAKLARVAVPTLSAELFKRGFQTRFFSGLKPLNPRAAKFCGAAFTIRAIPIREDLRTAIAKGDMPSRNRLAFDAAPRGSVVVCGTGGTPNNALMGDIMTTALMTKGVAGVVLDSGVSDAHIIGSMPIPVVAAGSAPVSSFAVTMVIEHDTPVGVQGVAVFPGDIIVGDENGALCIPRHLAEELADAAIEQERMEEWILERIKGGAPINGTYPPSAEVLAEYRAWRNQEKERNA
jgi:regulator of RNase E activity RraA